MPQRIHKKEKNSVLRRLWNIAIVRHLLYAVVGFPALITAINVALKVGTQHGKSFPVPDFTGMTVAEATAAGHAKRLRVEVIDSVFVPYRPPGSVFRQLPEAYAQVKDNRRVLLTINATTPRRVTVPDVVGYSLRQAKSVLVSQGLSVGRLRYIPDMATNNVLEQYYDGLPVVANMQLNAGSEIDLVLGLNLNRHGQYTTIPTVAGMSAETAKDVLLDYSLNARFHYDRNVTNYTDSLAARIYRQSPAPSLSMIWPLGTRVDVYLQPANDEPADGPNE
ncbi:MAG: PASTA domain-containing protein [Prevotellaceae bacterium]|jgi:beta-lactam-binding protein with PASTA domain|nr:PASTA domain-containing protein [Prevotellaceae bacterium]